MSQAGLVSELDSRNRNTRLLALETLRNLERLGVLDTTIQAGPVLPSYDHIHTVVSYGHDIPGLHSVARMVWAAHEAYASSTFLVEHESLLHCEEAGEAAVIVNEDAERPLSLALGVEFKAPLDRTDAAARRFGDVLAKRWGQGEAAWVVGAGVRSGSELMNLVARFQSAKRQRAEEQLERLNRHLGIDPSQELSNVATPEGNVTDRALSYAVASAVCGRDARGKCNRIAAEVRTLLGPGKPAYVPYPPGLPCYQDLVATLRRLGMTPVFTAQLRGRDLAEGLPLLKAWGIEGLDIAGIEPYERSAEEDVRHIIELAEKHGLACFGGADYRGAGTGWRSRAPWMDAPLIRESIERVATSVPSRHPIPSLATALS
jgi:hypothetical protein